MNLTSVETTPNPNSMKLNVDTDLGVAKTYAEEDELSKPDYVQSLLKIEGIKSVFVCHDFLTLNKDPRFDWRAILEQATAQMGGGKLVSNVSAQRESAEKDGQVHVLVQTFRGIPIQIKVLEAQAEGRSSLGERFNEAAQMVQQKLGADFLKERHWADYGIRYGEREDVAREIADEINGLFSEEHLKMIVSAALGETTSKSAVAPHSSDWLEHEDWHKRLAAVQSLSQSSRPDVVLLSRALVDSNPQVRRLAAAALGATGSADALPALCKSVLEDTNVGVRRTAGDALSDIGDVGAQPAMCKALADDNKLVRWRAARFLSDIGTADALPFLESASSDPEFEVRLEIEAAIQRIQGGGEGIGPAWKRIIER